MTDCAVTVWYALYVRDAIKQNESKVENNHFLVFDFFYWNII